MICDSVTFSMSNFTTTVNDRQTAEFPEFCYEIKQAFNFLLL